MPFMWEARTRGKGSKGSPSSGSNSKGYPKGAAKGFKGKSKDKGGKKGREKGKMNGKQQAMEDEEQVTKVAEGTWQEGAGDGTWFEESWEECGEQGALHPTEQGWFSPPFGSRRH